MVRGGFKKSLYDLTIAGRGGGGNLTPSLSFFLRQLNKYLSQKALIFWLFQLTHAPRLRLKAGLLCLLPEMPYFTDTRLDLYSDSNLLQFQHFIALWKAYKKKKQIAQFLQMNFVQIFAQTPSKGICTFSVFLKDTFRF